MYKYPDIDDQHLFKNVVDDHWDDGDLEDKYISESIGMLEANQRNYFLDAGCGTGKRLMHNYYAKFGHLAAIDPDEDRLNKAKRLFDKLKKNTPTLKTSAEFIQTKIENYGANEATFDCILCSHIIQHIPTGDIEKVLNNSYRILKPSGYMMLLTTNWIPGEDRYSMTNTKTNEYSPLTKKEFDIAAVKNDHFLPVQLFPENELKQLLEKAGFKIVFLKKYRGYPTVKGDNFVCVKKQAD